jgi:glycosyltransferase involved in cell wall biosynthesis
MPKVCILSSVHQALDNRIFYREARSLQQSGCDVVLIAVHDGREVRDGVQIEPLPRVRRWQRPLLWLRLCRCALATGADVFHFHDPELLFVVPWLRLLTGKPSVYDIHEQYADFISIKGYLPAWLRRTLGWTFAWLEPLLARLNSALIFADDQIAAAFAHIGRPQATLFNFPERSFIDAAAAATRGGKERPPVVLHLGGHEQNRGALLMIEAFQQVLQAMPEARLLLVGPFFPPGLEAQVREDIARRGMEGAITITGRVPFHEVGNYLKQAAVGWVALQPVPKYQKNVPTKIFEYMAYGLPVVASDLRPIRPFVADGENGYRVTADDPQAHAEAILRLLGRPAEALAMGERGRELVRTRFNWDEMAQRLLALYRQLLRWAG